MPAAPAIAEYRVRAVLNGAEIGQRLGADARSHQFSGLLAGQTYDIEITAVSAVGESFPPLVLRAAASSPAAP